ARELRRHEQSRAVRPEGFPGRQWRRCPLPGVRKSLPGYARAVRSAAVAHRTTSTPTFGGGPSTVTASFRWHVLTDESYHAIIAFSRWRGLCSSRFHGHAHGAAVAPVLVGNVRRTAAPASHTARGRCTSPHT